MIPNFAWSLTGILLILSFTLAAAETALTSLSPHQIRTLEKRQPGRWRYWIEHEERALAALLVTLNAVTAGMGCVATILSMKIHRAGIPPAVITGGVTLGVGVVSLFFGAILPKALARQNPEAWAMVLAAPVRALAWLLSPITSLLAGLVGGLGSNRAVEPLSAWELREILAHSSLPFKSKRILTNIVQFPSLPVRLVMTPREEIFSLDVNQDRREMLRAVAQSRFSRIPVTRGRSLDNVIGIVYSRDLLLAWRSQALIVLEDLLRPVHFVSVDSPLAESLRVFRTGQQHISLVKDPSGTVRGLVTLEDAVEAIIGPIPDETNTR